jgi:hypothetical protein
MCVAEDAFVRIVPPSVPPRKSGVTCAGTGGDLASVDNELPPDPDWDAVPPDLAEQHPRPVNVSYWDDEQNEVVQERATLVVVPQLHAWAERIEEGLSYWDDDDDS